MKKSIITVIAAILVLVLVSGAIVVGIGSDGFKNWNTDDWFNKQSAEQPETPENETTDKSLTVVDFQSTKLMRLSLASAAAETMSAKSSSAVTLTATLLPATATDKTVDWTVVFVNPSSSWASGKTASNYVSVTPTSDGSLTASVSAIAGFGEQIKVVVTSRVNPDATASCTVDYGSRLKDVATLTFANTIFAPSGSLTSSGVQSVETVRAVNWQAMLPMYGSLFSYAAEYKTPYTIASSTATATIAVKPTTELYNSFKSSGIAKSTNDWTVLSGDDCCNGKIYEGLCNVQLIPKNGADTIIFTNVNTFNSAIAAVSSTYDFDIKVTVDTDYETVDYIFQCKFNRSGAAFTATSASLNTTSIVL